MAGLPGVLGKMKICAVIPTYNEAKVIAGLVSRIKAMGLDVVVIDDGSTDNTGFCAGESGAVVLRNERKLGKGASLGKGFDFVRKMPFDGIMIMDGDGQHDPEDIKQFLAVAEKKQPCLIVGNRLGDPKGMPLIRRLTNRFMSYLLSQICRQGIPDSQCGFRFISSEILRKIKLRSRKFEIESEMLIKTGRQGFKIYSVPIRSIYGGEKSNINPLIDTVRFFRFLFRQIWTSPD
jgi:glycosyltransferase involved in cell wall biosynthesis